jgi:hypothetical protein
VNVVNMREKIHWCEGGSTHTHCAVLGLVGSALRAAHVARIPIDLTGVPKRCTLEQRDTWLNPRPSARGKEAPGEMGTYRQAGSSPIPSQ